jgi:hypothetical protein
LSWLKPKRDLGPVRNGFAVEEAHDNGEKGGALSHDVFGAMPRR